MSKDELYRKIKESRVHVTVNDLIKVLVNYGFQLRRTSKNHYIAQYKHHIISFAPPHPGKFVKKPYVNEVLKMIENVIRERGN